MSRIFIANTLLLLLSTVTVSAQNILPPTMAWKGGSESLIVNKNHSWVTKAEATDFKETSSYSETMEWLQKLTTSSDLVKIVSIGKSANGRDIAMVIVSADKDFSIQSLRNSNKPTLLAQAGIHAGEIDGKDAGLMLLRDIIHGKKKELISKVNLLFVPILNVDGHERTSPYNRVNQRGPDNMGWRTNARNLNLNRDYTKIDSEEIRAIIKVINDYNPTLYFDLHVTDGADYQYDITYGFSNSYSPSIGKWLGSVFTPYIDKQLQSFGHIPGPLMFAANDRDFTKGNLEFSFAARFSNNYGDLIHVPSILVENHSLKPYKQRVLGTYVFLEATLKLLSQQGHELKKSMDDDKLRRTDDVVITWKRSEKTESMTLLGISAEYTQSTVTNDTAIRWTGQPIKETIPFIRYNLADKKIIRPKAYWVPSTYPEVIDRLKKHGIIVEEITAPKNVDLTMKRISDYEFSPTPFEGHFMVACTAVPEKVTTTFYPGSVRISTDQPLGDLVVHLLEPEAPDSFFQWGFFLEIFNRTEYIEQYAIEPLAVQMLKDENLKKEFEEKKKNDPAFAANSQAIYEWFYTRSPYVDSQYLLYPVGIEE